LIDDKPSVTMQHAMVIQVETPKLFHTAASIWFEIWGSWILVKKIIFPFFIFPGKFPKNFDFFWQFNKQIRFSRQ